MKNERWQQIDALLEATLELPSEQRAAFLAEACAGDDTLRQEVESLLRAEERVGSFIETPAIGLAVEVLANKQASPQAGQRLGPYQILAPLGKGGMGEVFLAQDTRLGRKVALKLLPAGLAAETEARRRFTQEARAASALNHPHIITLYDIGTDAGRDFIAMEYIEGESLRTLLEREKIELKRTLDLLAQAAAGLAAAHEAHILHRDIKPENLMVTRSGQLKILDFGLAKLKRTRKSEGGTMKEEEETLFQDAPNTPRSAFRVHPSTLPGTILGTVAYMSPEQAAGRALDQRSDIFSLGVVLYEMLTGQRPFQGKSVVDVLHAIINDEPRAVLEVNPRLPVEVTEILGKALAKEVSERYQHAGDCELDLRRLKRAIESNSLLSTKAQMPLPTLPTATPSLTKTQRLTVAAFIVLALALGAVGAWWMGRGAGRTTPTWTTVRTIATQLTNYGGTEAGGALSPDGKSFVFVSQHGGTPDIWLRQIAGGEPVRLTNDAAEEADPIYAPDGETIYFTRSDGSDTSIWRIGALGGQARRVIGKARKPAPAPDGRSLAYLVSDLEGTGNAALVVSALDGSGTRTLARGLLGGLGIIRAAWSPDGRWLSYASRGLFAPSNLFIVEVNTGQTRQVTQFNQSHQAIEAQTWLPDNRHLVISYVPQPAWFQSDLGVLDIQDGSISRLTFNVGGTFDSLSVSADGTRLIATAIQTRREVWKVPLGPDAEANGRAAVRVLDSSQDPMWTFVSRDGRTLLFNNAVTGTRNLWTMPLDGSAPPHQITAIAGDNVMHSSLSPDGARVAFASRARGNSDIWVQNVDGSELHQLTNDEAADFWPAWSPDGEWIVFGSIRSGRQETWRVSAAGGPAEKVVDGFFRGDWIRQPGGTGTWLVSWTGGVRLIDFERHTVVWEERLTGATSLPMFSADGRFISVSRSESRDREAIWLYETATGKSRLAVKFSEPFRMNFRACWVDNDKALIVNRYQTPSRIVLFDQFWGKAGAQN